MISAALAVLESEEQRNELSEIYENNISNCYNIAFQQLHNKHDAEDAIQDAFLAIANNTSIFFGIPNENKMPYINAVIRNISCKLWNKKHATAEREVEFNEQLIEDSIPLDERIVSEYSCEDIYRFIDTFPDTTKTAIYFRIHFDMKYSDIAKTLNISEDAAKKRVERAIAKIKQFMEGYCSNNSLKIVSLLMNG